MRHRTDPRVLLVVSVESGAGKTTLLEGLVPRLRESGLRVAAVKRTHHDVELDPTGKDSRRLRDAGAAPVVLRGPRLTTIFAPTPTGDELATLVGAATAFGPLDLVLVEGGREMAVHARIEIVLLGAGVVSDPATLLAVASEGPAQLPPNVPCFRRDDVAGLATRIAAWVRG
jgi:molybdopterin-guanine dinucleotide biosynthesis adapter protein